MMTIKLNHPKTVEFSKPNGIFIVFDDYEHEDDFQNFLEFLASKLNLPTPESIQYPYSQLAELSLPEGEIIAMFHDDTGCCVRVEPGEQALAEHIVCACYGDATG